MMKADDITTEELVKYCNYTLPKDRHEELRPIIENDELLLGARNGIDLMIKQGMTERAILEQVQKSADDIKHNILMKFFDAQKLAIECKACGNPLDENAIVESELCTPCFTSNA